MGDLIKIPQQMFDGENYATGNPSKPFQRVPFELILAHELGHVYERLLGVNGHTHAYDIERDVAKDLGLPSAENWEDNYIIGSADSPCDNVILKNTSSKNVAPPSDPAQDMNDKKEAAKPKQSPLVLDLDFSGTIDLVSMDDIQVRYLCRAQNF